MLLRLNEHDYSECIEGAWGCTALIFHVGVLVCVLGHKVGWFM